MCWREGERGSGAGEHDGREVLRRLRAALTGRYCGACGRDYGATDAAQRASCPLATVQQDSSSTAGAQQEVAEAQQDVSSSTAGAQRAVSPTSRPCAREGGGRAHGARRNLNADVIGR